MSNSFRPIESPKNVDNFENQQNKYYTAPKEQSKRKPRKKKRNIIGKFFALLFNGKALKEIGTRKNWSFIAFLFVLLIILGYNSLSYKSKQVKINKLNEQITFRKDEVMNMKEELYNMDYSVEKQLEEEAVAEGFNLGGYIPFVIKSATNKKEK